MKNLKFNLFYLFNKNKVVNLAVLDGFNGNVRILSKHKNQVLLEIVDVFMCYPSQHQLKPGDRIWENIEDIVK